MQCRVVQTPEGIKSSDNSREKKAPSVQIYKTTALKLVPFLSAASRVGSRSHATQILFVQALEGIKAEMAAVQKKPLPEEIKRAMAEKLVNSLYAASGPAKLKSVVEQVQHALDEGKTEHNLFSKFDFACFWKHCPIAWPSSKASWSRCTMPWKKL